MSCLLGNGTKEAGIESRRIIMWLSPMALHIPDGFISPVVALVGWALALVMIGIAIRQTHHQLGERQIPLMGVLAAFIFAAQAINFPIAAGTSGHLLGGMLAAIVVGPWGAMLIMTSVIAIQGLLFQDGGLLVMGWNILNMGVFSTLVGYAVYAFIRRVTGEKENMRLAAVFIGAWVAVEVGAIATALELAVSGTSPLRIGLPAMTGVHALIGLGEGLITVGAVMLLRSTRPEILAEGETAPGRGSAVFVAVGLLVALFVALLSPLASSSPDGLEFVAEREGFLGQALDPLYAILPDYTVPFIEHEAITTILAVVVGTLVVFGVAWLVGRIIMRRGVVRE
jgi:cobalt/nickel transport system permease protein